MSLALLAPCLVSVVYDAVVVGAGYAGMAAAHKLTAAGLDVVVLEAADRVGGRIRNYLPSDGSYDVIGDSVVEVGGTFVSPSHTALIQFASQMGVDVYNVSAGGGVTSRRRPRVPDTRLGEPVSTWPWWYWGVDTEADMAESVLHTESGTLTFHSPEELKSKLSGMAVFDELEAAGGTMSSTIAGLSCEAADEHWADFDGITFEGWIRKHVSHEEGRSVLRAMCRGMIAQEPSQVSFLSTAKSLKGCWSAGDDDQYRLRGGSQAPLLEAAKRLGITKLRLSSPVRAVRQAKKHATKAHGRDDDLADAARTYEVATDGATYEAKSVILTGTPAALTAIHIPLLGANDAQLLQRMPMGESAKLFFFYSAPWWRAAGKSANVMSTTGYTACMDHSAYDADSGSAALMCWLEGATNLGFFGRENRTAATEEVLAFLQASLDNDPRVHEYTSTVCLDWPEDVYARGAYTGFFTPGVQSQPTFWDAFRRTEKAPGLFVAGADYYAGVGNGYMEGAVRSGEAAAKTIIGRVG